MAKIIKQQFVIENMHCTSCALLIDSDVEDIEGVICATTNFAKSETEIEYDEEKIEIGMIIQTIAKTGYRAKPKLEKVK